MLLKIGSVPIFLMLMMDMVKVGVAQTPIRAVKIEAAPGASNPITITVTGTEQDQPTLVTPKWNASNVCLADMSCFLSSWVAANTSGDSAHLLLLRSAAERIDLEKRFTQEPRLLTLNSARFQSSRSWGFLGWVEFGTYRFLLLFNEDQQGSLSSFTLPLEREENNNWAQTDALSKQTYVFAIVDRVAKAILGKHPKK